MLVNPASGKGRGAKAAAAAIARLRELGAEVTELSGTTAHEGRILAQQALRSQPDALVIVGGDGTLSGVLDEIAHSGTPIALVPAGTGNDFARAIGLPLGGPDAAADAAALAVHGEVRAVDVGCAESGERSVKFLTIAALGFDALVSERTNTLRWPKGALRYYLALVIELIRLRPLRFSVSIDDEPSKSLPGILAAVGNTSSYGGGMPICPNASPADGTLDLTHVAPLGRLRLLLLFPLLLRAKHLGRAEVLSRRCKSVRISAPGLVVYADGERVGIESVRVAVLPAALRVCVPRSHADPLAQPEAADKAVS